MSKNYRIQDRILLAMATFIDVADEIVGGGHRAYRYGKLLTYTPPGYKKRSLSSAVCRMLAAGDLKKTIKNGQPYFQISGIGQKKLTRRFPLLKWQNQKWDGLWRMVVFDIKEKNRKTRQLLRMKLLELGFGKLQQSIYISPYNLAEDVFEYVQLHKLEQQVYVLVNRHLYVKNFNILVNKIWELNKINEKYLKIFEHLQTTSLISKKKMRKLITRYLDVVSQDPFLPKQLLPQPWYGFKLQKMLQKTVRPSS